MFESILFYTFSLLAITAGVLVVTLRNPISSAIALVGSFLKQDEWRKRRRSGGAMPIPVNDDPIPSELKASCLMDVESMEESLCTLQSLSMDVQAHNFEVVEKPG